MNPDTDGRVCFGEEIEYRCTLRRREEILPPSRLLQVLPKIVAALLDPARNGWFVACGGRCYFDPSGHLEWATPEVTSPHDAIRYIHAGHILMTRLAKALAEQQPRIEITISRHNMDYHQNASWGCHTSFLTRCIHTDVAAQVTAFLASKMIFDGAGGFQIRNATPRFSLAPRLELHRNLLGGDTQRQRALVCTREERAGLAGRQHLTCNESLCSQLAEYLRFGTTALVLKVLEAGALRGVQLADPLGALRKFAADPTCTVRVPTPDGAKLSALEIQGWYLEQVEAQLGASWLPPWSREVCRRWRRVLDRLAAGAPESVVGRLDWATKWALFRAYETEQPNCETLFEIDARFGEIGSGFWDQMDRDGLLQHRILHDADLLSAFDTPPADTRARRRGEAIRELSGENDAVRAAGVASWEFVRDGERERFLDLKEPFQVQAAWSDSPQRSKRPTATATSPSFEDLLDL